jgi:hypothetical protein
LWYTYTIANLFLINNFSWQIVSVFLMELFVMVSNISMNAL